MNVNKIYLIGMPGSGKSTLGKKLALDLGILFVDLDVQIELKEGVSIRELFTAKGEDYFRKLESSMLREYGAMSNSFVMATGGGTPCFYDNMEFMNETGTSVFVDVPVEELVRRMNQSNTSKRPLLSDSQNLSARLTELREARLSFYNQGKIKLTDRFDLGQALKDFERGAT